MVVEMTRLRHRLAKLFSHFGHMNIVDKVVQYVVTNIVDNPDDV